MSQLDLEQVHSAVRLLIDTIRNNMTDNQSKQFAEQLLHITLAYLHKVVQNIVKAQKEAELAGHSNVAFERDVEKALTTLTLYIKDLRQFMQGVPQGMFRRTHSHGQQQVRDEVDGQQNQMYYTLTDTQRKMIAEWNKLSDRVLIFLCIDKTLQLQSWTLGTSPMSLTSKNKHELVKVPVHFLMLTSPNF